MGDFTLNTNTSSADRTVLSNSRSKHILSVQRNLKRNHSLNCHISEQNTIGQIFSRNQTETCWSNHNSPISEIVSTACEYNQHIQESTPDITNTTNILNNRFCDNQNTEYYQRDSISKHHKSTLQTLPLITLNNKNKNDILDQRLLSSSNPHFLYRLPKSVSFCSDYETACSSPLNITHLNANITLVNQSTNQVYSKTTRENSTTLENNALSSMAATSDMVQETEEYSGSIRNTGSVFSRSLLLPYINDRNQTSSPTDIMDNRTHCSSSTPNVTILEESINECPSPQVSDLGSEDTHISVSQPNFAQSYAHLTPWTSKITAPGYIPLPKPASDAMPIPMDYMLSVPPHSQESVYTRSNQVYGHLKPEMTIGCYDETSYSSKSKSGTLYTHRPHYKMMPNKEHRFRRTAEALQKSGLWEVAMKTGNLMKRNRELQKELEDFRSDAVAFLKSVIKNPENRDFIKNVLNTALTSNTASHNLSSVMAVVVSAAAAKASARLDSSDCSSDDSMSGNTST